MRDNFQIRRATRADRDDIRAMQNHAMRVLAAPYYSEDVIEAFIGSTGTMDDTLIDEGTFTIVLSGGSVVGSGGWSTRAPGYAALAVGEGSDDTGRQATVRSVFVHPEFARRGIARRLMDLVERQIVAVGFDEACLAATRSGIPLYRRLGWRGRRPVVLTLPGGLTFEGLAMTKRLVAPGSQATVSAA